MNKKSAINPQPSALEEIVNEWRFQWTSIMTTNDGNGRAARANKAIAELARYQRIEAAARALMPLTWEEGMEGETPFERAVIKLRAALNESES